MTEHERLIRQAFLAWLDSEIDQYERALSTHYARRSTQQSHLRNVKAFRNWVAKGKFPGSSWNAA